MGKTSKKPRAAVAPAAPETSSTPPLGKFLASTEKSVRDKAIKKLAAFLSRASEGEDGEGQGGGRLDPKEMQKLWKGLFYCFWMSDKPLVQQALASELSSLILLVDPKGVDTLRERTLVALEFVGGFWEATVREWSGIDRLRLDKYYMLVRRFTNATLRLLQRSNWDPVCIDAYNAILTKAEGGPLSWQDHRVPTAIPYHLSDLYLTELATLPAASSPSAASPPSSTTLNSTTSSSSSPPPATAPLPLAHLLLPFTTLLLHTPTATLLTRLLASLYTPLLRTDEWEGLTELDVESGVGKSKKGEVMKGLFEEAGKEGSRDANRRKVFGFWKECGGGVEGEEEDL